MNGCDRATIKHSTTQLLAALKRAHPEICGAPPARWWRTRKPVSGNGCIDHLIDRAVSIAGVGHEQLLCAERNRRLSRVRFAIVYVSVREGYGFSAIGREMKRDHSSIIHAYRRASELVETDATFARLCRQIEAGA